MALRIKPSISEPIQTAQPVRSGRHLEEHPILSSRFHAGKHYRPLRLLIGSYRACCCLSGGRKSFLRSA